MIWIAIATINKNIQLKLSSLLPAEAFSGMKEAVDSGHLPRVQDLTKQGFPEDLAGHLVDHLTYLKGLYEKKVLKGGGPCAGFEKAILIYECNTEAEARTHLENDPYFKNAIFTKSYDIYLWYKVF